MYKNKRVLAVVTARGGSKGLPGKNIKILNGKPLIAWTIQQAKDSQYIDKLFVSTDSSEIASVSEAYGAVIDELRPDYLAQDSSSSMDVLSYVIEYHEKRNDYYDYVILLEPTSPLRKKNDIDNIIKLAIDNEMADGVISVGAVHTEHPSIIKKVSADKYIVPYEDAKNIPYQRQLQDVALFPYGVGYVFKTDVFKERHTFYTEKMLPYYIDRWQNYEIDDIYDFMCIETIAKEMLVNE